jgi:hypothetical protein
MMRQRGFVLLSIILTMSLLAMLALWLNHENGMRITRFTAQANSDRARYAAEAGLRALNAKVQVRDCALTTTSVDNPDFGGASYTAAVTSVGSGGSPVTLQSTGSYQGSSVTLTRPGTYAYPQDTDDYTLQPNAAAGIDTYLTNSSASNFGTSDLMRISNTNSFWIQFDLSAFPVGTLPDQLELSLRIKDYFFGIAMTGYVHRVQLPWTETGANWLTRDGTLNWLNPGGDFHATSLASASSGSDDWLDLGITELGVAWMSGRYPNNGIRLRTTSLGLMDLVTSDHADSSRRPKLSISYRSPCGSSGP